MINELKYNKESSEYNEEFGEILTIIIELIRKEKLKEIRVGFSYHYCKLDCKNLKVFWRYNKKRMNYAKLVFKTKDFEMEADQQSWEKITIKPREVEIETRGGNIYFVFKNSVKKKCTLT